jgi:hypothetical protein
MVKMKPSGEFSLEGWHYDLRSDESRSNNNYFHIEPQKHREINIPVVIPSYATDEMSNQLFVRISDFHQSSSDPPEPQFTTVVSSPTSIKQIGHLDVSAQDIAIQGDFAYVAAGVNGLRVFDISDPTTPIEVGVYDAWGDTWDVAVKDNYIYAIFGSCDVPDYHRGNQSVSCHDSDLFVIDASTPPKLVETSKYDLPADNYESHLQKLEIMGDNLYIKNALGQLHILNLSEPATPRKVNFPDTLVNDFFLTEPYLYLVPPNNFTFLAEGGLTSDSYVKILDRSSLIEIGSYNLPEMSPALEVIVIDRLAYIRTGIPCVGVCQTSYYYDWFVLDVSEPTAPVEIVDIRYEPIEGRDITFTDGYAYLADGKAGLRVLDITNSRYPIEVDAFGAGEPRNAFNVEESGGYIYLASGEGGLSILQYEE